MKRSLSLIPVVGALVLAGALLAGCGSSGSREGNIGPGGTSAVQVQKGDPVLAAASGYVGSVRCAACHPDIFAEWGQTLHNKALKTVAEVGDRAFVNIRNGNGTNDFRVGVDLATVSADFAGFGANAPRLSVSAAGKYLVTIGAVQYEVQRVQGGNGYWVQRYHTRIGRSYYVLPFQYNEVEKTYTAYQADAWYGGVTPRFTEAYGSAALVAQFNALNNGTDFKGTALAFENQCAGCHVTGFAVASESSDYGGTSVAEVVTGYVDLNIGCESCHGPGGIHVTTLQASDIVNPGSFTLTGVEGVKRANEVCGGCHSRGTSASLAGMSLPMQAPGRLSGTTFTPFRPGNNLLNDLGATGAYVTLSTAAADYWGTLNYTAADVNHKFPLFDASRNHHQQYQDIGQGPHAADKAYDVPCWGCHSPHSSANRHMIATTVKEGGVTKVANTREENDTLCLACHATFGDFAALATADVQTVANGGSSSSVDTAIRGHMVTRANMDVALDLANGVGRCTACHMPKTARSAAFSSSFLDADGKQKGDIRAHILNVPMPNVNVLDVPNTFFNASGSDNSVATSMPNGCSGCHNGSSSSSVTAGDAEIYGWARSGHADYLDVGIGGYSDRLNRGPATAEHYNSASNASCVSCHTEEGYVTLLGGGTPAAHFIAPTEKNYLNCRTCHDAAESAANKHVRQIATFTFPDNLAVTTGGNAKVCFHCHAGRKSKADVVAAAAAGAPYTFVDVHAFPAAAVLYGPQAQGGYEYAGKTYLFNAFHVGASCTGCHMAAAPGGNRDIGGHALSMSAGSALNTTACSALSCHGPVSSFDVNGNDRSGTIDALLTELDNALTAQGVAHAAYPPYTNITTAAQLRATYNHNVVSNDPGAYVHNFRYAAELLYDSLDELDDGLLNGSVAFPGKEQFGR